MDVEIAIVSDTHMPRGPRRLPEPCLQRLRRAGLIIHAGDFGQLSVLHQLQALGDVVAVYGNVDDSDLRTTLPAVATVRFHGRRIIVVHDAGRAQGRQARLRRRFPDAAAVIFGHSHLPVHERGPDGFQIFNPGSPTERRRAPHHTMGVAHVSAAGIDFELIELD